MAFRRRMNPPREEKTVEIGWGIFAPLLAIAFIVLKLTDVIDWSWLWVLSPIWIPFINSYSGTYNCVYFPYSPMNVICSYCGETYPDIEITSDLAGNSICQPCVNNELTTAVSIKFFEPNGMRSFIWSPVFGFQESGTMNKVDSIPAIAGIKDNKPILHGGFMPIISDWRYNLSMGDKFPDIYQETITW